MAANTSASHTPSQEEGRRGTSEEHEHDVEEREACEYWGYLFQTDKTGTDTLKSLLRGLHNVMNEAYEPSESPDLTPNQLAHFYRDLHGNYDQLFLGTPSESIAFIYKSLGCLYSLQPLPHSTVVTEPTVPALKSEGWIMWQTIQLLLGPDEHAGFLIEAVHKWDVKHPVTGETFPKVLPRRCFPLEPDKHMVAWYEGVSERLRKEAEDEERQRNVEAQQAEVRRIHNKSRRDAAADDEISVDSREHALRYFRDPLGRLDVRPSIVRHRTKHPTMGSPRTTMMDMGKEAASSVGHVIKNISSPFMRDTRHRSRSRDPERERRRRSLPENKRHSGSEEPGFSAGRLSPGRANQHRRRSAQFSSSSYDSGNDASEGAGLPPNPSHASHRHHRSGEHDSGLRYSRSHEPTPSSKEYPDYFHGYDDPTHLSPSDPATPPFPSFGPSFGPSASPLFATQVAKYPQPMVPPAAARNARGATGPRPPHASDQPSANRPPPTRSPDLDPRHPVDDRRRHEMRDSRRRSPASGYDDAPGKHRRRDSRDDGASWSPPREPLPARSRRQSEGEMAAYGGAGSRERERDRDRDREPKHRQKQTRFAPGPDSRRPGSDRSRW